MERCDIQLPLFEGLQPWTKLPGDLTEDQQAERRALLAHVADTNQLVRTEQRVVYILRRYPETRDRLFAPSPYARQRRFEQQMEFYEYLAAQRTGVTEIRFFLDETGTSVGEPFAGVAGICIINWRQYEKYHASLSRWRERTGWLNTIRFTEMGSADQPKAIELLNQVRRRREGLLFVGYPFPQRGHTHYTRLTLFVQLVIDSLRHLDSLECLNEPRAVVVTKEAEEGFDRHLLEALKHNLAEQIHQAFPDGRVHLRDVQPLPKGREVFLETADLIAGGMQRRARYDSAKPKDVLSDAVLNMTGFDDPRDNGIVVKAYPP